MGKHDKHIEASSEEFLRNRIARLEKENKELKDEIVFRNDTIRQLQKQCSRMSKWASEIEANAREAVEDLRAEVEKWKGKALEVRMTRDVELPADLKNGALVTIKGSLSNRAFTVNGDRRVEHMLWAREVYVAQQYEPKGEKADSFEKLEEDMPF